MERDVAWKKYDEADLEALEHLAAEYIDFISDNKTERECAASAVALAEEHGYLPLDQAVREGRALKAGDKVWAQAHGKALILAHLGQRPLEQGLNILGAHIDSPRLDLKQNPLFDTHYYGGIKNYQWVTLPLALHGVIAKKDGTVVDVKVGDDPDDPVFCVTDLLIHLAGKQMAKKANEVVEGEDLDILMGNRPLTWSGSLDGTQSLGSPGSHGQSAGLSGSCGTRLVGTAEAPGESAASVATSEDVQAPADGEKEEECLKEAIKIAEKTWEKIEASEFWTDYSSMQHDLVTLEIDNGKLETAEQNLALLYDKTAAHILEKNVKEDTTDHYWDIDYIAFKYEDIANINETIRIYLAALYILLEKKPDSKILTDRQDGIGQLCVVLQQLLEKEYDSDVTNSIIEAKRHLQEFLEDTAYDQERVLLLLQKIAEKYQYKDFEFKHDIR